MRKRAGVPSDRSPYPSSLNPNFRFGTSRIYGRNGLDGGTTDSDDLTESHAVTVLIKGDDYSSYIFYQTIVIL